MNFLKPYFQLMLFLGVISFGMISCGEDSGDPAISCTDGIMNGDETGVDCGGDCPDCITCTDGIMNGDETGIDCGGSCPDACPTCTDGIMNGDETGIDCGGSCPDACTPQGEFMTAIIDGAAFSANLVSGFDDGTIISFQSDQSQESQLFFEIPTGGNLGTYDVLTTANVSATYVDFPTTYTTESGTINITSYDDTVNPTMMNGTFELTSVLYDFGNPIDTVVVTNGAFGVEVFN